MEHHFGPFYSSDQVTILFKVCLDKGLCCNALELSQLVYQGHLEYDKRSVRFWMPFDAAKGVKVEQKEPAPGTSASAITATPNTGVATGGGSGNSKTELSVE